MAPKEAQLGTVFTIPQVAKMAGWTTTRMRRHLLAKHRELDGGLLRNVSRGTRRPRWTITLSALQAIAPQWFLDPESLQRQIDFLASELEDAREKLAILSKRVELQHKNIVALARVSAPRKAG